VVVLDAGFPRVDAGVVARLVAASVVLVGVSADEAGEQRLRQWGVDLIVSVSPKRPTDAVGDIVDTLLEAGGAMAESRFAITPRRIVDATTSRPSGVMSHPGTGDGSGLVVAVWGPAGAPGRTTIAVALAEQLAAVGRECMVVDADVYAPGVGDLLGMPTDGSGLIAACRQADQGTLDVASLARAARSLGPRLRVLTGLPHPNRRLECRPAALRSVWATARLLADYTVIDVGASSDADLDDQAVFDESVAAMATPASGALSSADVLVAVTGCEPIAVARLLSAAGQVIDASAGADLHVVVNKVRGAVLGARELGELTALLVQRLAPRAVWVVADERDACDRAASRGLTLCEYAPTSRASRTLGELAAAIDQDTRLDVSGVG
ncbi:MAG: hypothetical protein WCI74_14780, partial [Actinomycetes bacterium]